MVIQAVDAEPKVEYWAIPAELFVDIQEYMTAGRHGSLTVNFVAGKISKWSLTKTGKIDKCDADNLT